MAMRASMSLGIFKDKDWFEKNLAHVALEAVAETQEEVYAMFKLTTATWHYKPTFEKSTIKMEKNKVSAYVSTDDENYVRINNGTRPRAITPANGKPMAFYTGFTPKTRKRTIGSSAGGRSGKKIIRNRVGIGGHRKLHQIEAREFDAKIAEDAQAFLKQSIDKNLEKWLP